MHELSKTVQDRETGEFAAWLNRTSLAGAVVFVVFSVLDLIVFPDRAPRFLLYRIAIACYLSATAYIALSLVRYRQLVMLGLLAVIASAATIEVMILQTGGHASPYGTGMILLTVCVLAFFQGSIRLHIGIAVCIYMLYAVPILATERITDIKSFSLSNFFLVSIILSMLVLRYIAYRNVQEQETARRHAESALRESEARFRTLAQASFEGMVISQHGIIHDCNEELAGMLGYEREELISKPIRELLPGDTNEQVLVKILSNQESNVTHELLCKDGSLRSIEARGKMISLHGQEFRITAINDITERKRTEQELDQYRQKLEEMVLQRTEELQKTITQLIHEIRERAAIEEDLKTNRMFLNNILNSIQDPIMVLDRNQHILMTNRWFEATFMHGDAAHSPAKTCYEVFYHRSDPCESCLAQVSMASGETISRMMPYGKDESTLRLYEVHAFPFAATDGRAIGSVHHMRDITERRQAEEKVVKYQQHLRSFAHQLMTTEERERRKIAQELHDGFPQKLVLSKMLLQTIQNTIPPGDASAKMFDRIYAIYDDMTKEVRSLTYQLAPPVLYEVGLEPALERMLKNMLDGVALAWEFENWRRGDPIKGEIATVLYAMVRELVMNVIKYAVARHLKVTIAQLDDLIVIAVQDDGRGMPEGIARQERKGLEMRGFGLFSIRERLRYLKGSLTIDSGPGKGTIVRIEVPCDTPKTPQQMLGKPSG